MIRLLRGRPFVAAVSGPSMVPTLRPGDRVLVVGGLGVRPGHVVVARYRAMPDRLVIKRAVHAVDDGWWLASDNPFAGGDSVAHGVADVRGRVVLVRRGLRVVPLRRARHIERARRDGPVPDSDGRATPGPRDTAP